ncbi:hypothetical protein ACFXPF_08080, partial [Streptomyces sp. NPDC059131]
MSMKPLEHDRRYGELDQVMRAYLGQPADDTPERRSNALDAYLRRTWHDRPAAIAEAERQLREYSRNPPGRIRHGLGEFYAIPDIGMPHLLRRLVPVPGDDAVRPLIRSPWPSGPGARSAAGSAAETRSGRHRASRGRSPVVGGRSRRVGPSPTGRPSDPRSAGVQRAPTVSPHVLWTFDRALGQA